MKTAIPFLLLTLLVFRPDAATGGMATWDGRHPIDRIEVRIVYFIPRDRSPLIDWKDRVTYFARRIEEFHAREYGDQSKLTTRVESEPLRSTRTTEQLRSGDADFIFFQTLQEADERLEFARPKPDAFPILLVLSEINWRPLDDFYRLSREPKGERAGEIAFEGNLSGDRHFPGAASGGARATYLSDRGVGWGLVSADGWRVPYSGSDCVVYHEGVGHTGGLPHPDEANGSVMSHGQYRGWISESWIDDDQKKRLGWKPPEKPFDREADLFSQFRAIPEPAAPRPGEMAALRLNWPKDVSVKSLRVRIQTELNGPWIDVPVEPRTTPSQVLLSRFDRPTPVSYRVNTELVSGQRAELWGYFQVRNRPNETVIPQGPLPELDVRESSGTPGAPEMVDLLKLIRPDSDAVSGEWKSEGGAILSPQRSGARIEVPYEPPAEYRMVAVVEPLDEPNALILGQRSGENRWLVLLGFLTGGKSLSALENVDDRNVGANRTTVAGAVFRKGQPSQVICTVRKESVVVSVDGRTLIDWQGTPDRLSLSDYWQTPRKNSLFVGAYDCRYRISRLTLEPLSPGGRVLEDEKKEASNQ